MVGTMVSIASDLTPTTSKKGNDSLVPGKIFFPLYFLPKLFIIFRKHLVLMFCI